LIHAKLLFSGVSSFEVIRGPSPPTLPRRQTARKVVSDQ
jgi:hypothetical protein